MRQAGFRLCDDCLPSTITEWREAQSSPQWSRRIRHKYDMSADDHGRLYADQGGKCAICEDPARSARTEVDNSGLVVDHDHATGEVRALLCARCNLALGLLDDNPNWFHAAMWYLRSHGNSSPRDESAIRARDYVEKQKAQKRAVGRN